jgi:RNA polymerase sigma-70 factor, ECF subfamily
MDRKADDRAFFRAEIERLMDCLYGNALRLTRNPADAEDLVSETVVKAWAGLDQLQDRQSFPKWILRILANTFISNCRRKGHACESLDELGELSCDEERFSLFEKMHQPFLLWWSNPEREFVNKLLREDIERALDGLPVGFRTVVVLVEIQGYSYAEAAEILGVPVGTVRSRLSRARSMLQRALWQQATEAGLLDHEHKRDEKVNAQ